MEPTKSKRPVLFFDIDNCLYPKSLCPETITIAALADIVGTGNNINEMMVELINDYFARHLELSAEDAKMLHQKYYKDYGLAITGLALHHKIAPLEFNREVDDALPLDDIISFNPQLRQLLADIDKAKVKMWLFTNAYITHAQRVVRLLGIEDMFEGITYCDYSRVPIRSKPHTEMYEKAEFEAGASSVDGCFFVGKRLKYFSRHTAVLLHLNFD
ncbi:MAG: hypothetical protein Q9191_002518 [Dirinaria sp. TL-2023a]